jgi:acetyl esterase
MLDELAAPALDAAPQPWHSQVELIERRIPGPIDAPEVRVRIYRPTSEARRRPCLLYYHGGAFVLGGIGLFDSVCAGYAVDVDVVVVSVDYRLAPEHPFPAAPEDCYAALMWAAIQADELAVDPTCLAVGGASAGGGLAAAVALMARDRRGPTLVDSADVAVMWDLYLGSERSEYKRETAITARF